MREGKLELSLLAFKAILDVQIVKRVNEHGSATITGIIDETEESKAFSDVKEECFATLSILSEEDGRSGIFSGVVESFRVRTEGNVRTAVVTLTGGTRLLEGIPKTRTFQNTAISYEELISSIDQDYSRCGHMPASQLQNPLKHIMVQYREDDWTFLKRIASHFHEPVISLPVREGIFYQIGLNEDAKAQSLSSISYQVCNDIQRYHDKKRNQVDEVMYEDEYCYLVESRDVFEVGSRVDFNRTPLWVYEVTSKLTHGELIHSYLLKRKNGFKDRTVYNHGLIGASLDAKVIDIERDRVKVHVLADESQDKAAAAWFPYSTVYSSPDGTGWYCMPEAGDSVRLYFPNEHEEEGYMISSVNVEPKEGGADGEGSSGGKTPPRSNPDHKSISNKYHKQIELTPTSIVITNNDGLTLKLEDQEGITISSNKKVCIESEDELSIQSRNAKMRMEAKEAIELIQGSAKLTMKDEVTIEGAKFKVQ